MATVKESSWISCMCGTRDHPLRSHNRWLIIHSLLSLYSRVSRALAIAIFLHFMHAVTLA